MKRPVRIRPTLVKQKPVGGYEMDLQIILVLGHHRIPATIDGARRLRDFLNNYLK